MNAIIRFTLQYKFLYKNTNKNTICFEFEVKWQLHCIFSYAITQCLFTHTFVYIFIQYICIYTQQTSTNLMYYIISKHQMNEIHSQLVHVLVESMILSWCCSTISASSMRTMPLRQFQCCCLTERQHTVLRAAQFFLATYLRIASVWNCKLYIMLNCEVTSVFL